MSTRVDVALIHPLVYSLRPWLALRRRLHEVVRVGGPEATGLSGATVHLEGIPEPLFDPGLDGVSDLPSAFGELLRQARAYPCLLFRLERSTGERLRGSTPIPSGFHPESSETLLLFPRNGEPALIQVCTGLLSSLPADEDDGGLQRQLRRFCTGVLSVGLEATLGTVDMIVERILGCATPEPAAATLQASEGHLVTFAHDAGADLVERLSRVHRIQEGTAADQRALMLPDGGDEPLWVHFGWSYTTVATPRLALAYRLLFPLIAVNQAWYRYRSFREDVIELSRSIDGLRTDAELATHSELYSQVVLELRVWEAEREAFERGLRPVYRSAYDTLWTYWDTDESRETVHRGIEYTRDFLERKYNVKIVARETTQSRILFVIALFQLLSIFGLVSGYLWFWEKTRLPEELIYRSEALVWITLLGPVAVLVLIAWLLVTFFRRNR